MRIINTIKIFVFGYFILNFLTGCAVKDARGLAKEYADKSEQFYRKAVREYKGLISSGEATDEIYFKLGKIYFTHGDYDSALLYLPKSSSPEARKLEAFAYYKKGEFTDALGLFERISNLEDDQHLYYYGLASEKLNLYEQAAKIYAKIKNRPYSHLAKRRISVISQLDQDRLLDDLDVEFKKIIRNAPGKELYPQASAVILLAEEEIEVSPGNTALYNLHFIIKILDQRGKKNFSEVVIGYDSTYEKPELEYARTIRPDGKIVSVGKKHIRDVVKYLNFPLYSNARALIISMPEITEGAIVEYKLKIYKNRLINKKDFVLNYWLQESEPVLRSNFTLIVPKGEALQLRRLNEKYNHFSANLEPLISEDKDKTRYEWKFKDLPQIIPEPHMPPLIEINPAILVSTFDSWESVYQWWWELAQDKIRSSEQIKKQVKELIKGAKSDEEKLRSIYNFCAQKIRYVAVEYGQAGYEPHKAQDIFLNKYGDCKDQAVLLVTMLREAGFKAHLVLIGTRDYFDLLEDFPSVLFNHCIAVVRTQDKEIFLDPTLQTCSFGDLPLGDQERKVLIFKEDSYDIKTTPLYPASHNRLRRTFQIEVEANEHIRVEKEVFSYGFYDQVQRSWLLYTQPELIRQKLEQVIQDVSVGAELEDYQIKNLKDLNQGLVLSYNFHGPQYWTRAGDLRILPQLAELDGSLVAKESRRYRVDFRLLDSEELSFKIIIPANFVIKYLPEDIHVDNRWFQFDSSYTTEGGIIYFKQKRVFKKKDILVRDYAQFKELYQGLARRLQQRIVLEQEG